MAENKSKKSKYESRYGGGFITAGQLIAEKVCELQAFADKKTLGDRFWQKPEWKKSFIYQASLASKLAETYCVQVILQVLDSKELQYKKVKSLGAKYALIPLLNAAQKDFDAKLKSIENTPDVEYDNVNTEVRPTIPKKNTIFKPGL